METALEAPGPAAQRGTARGSAFVLSLTIAAIVWGAFAFGAVYPWAYDPLAAAAATAGAAGLLVSKRASLPTLRLGPLATSFVVFLASVLLQTIPLPLKVVQYVSPGAMPMISAYDLRVATAVAGRHALLIDPDRTWIGAALFGALALLVMGSARLLSLRGARGAAEAVALVGVMLALAGIVQQPLYSGRIYGFWMPQMGGNPFGPFVNRNHFAGWMLMALPVTLGLVGGGLARSMRGVKPNGRDRLVWFSSPDASRLILIAAAAVVMALSLVLTMSRGGIAALSLAIATTGVVMIRRQRTRGRRAVGSAYLLLLAIVVVGWAGADAIASRFSQADWHDFNDRRGPWADAIGIASRFPLTGTGFDTYGIATLFYQRHNLAQHFNEAHNDYLQLAAEGGVLLVVPAFGCFAAFTVAVRRRFREETSTRAYWLRVGALTGIAAIALQETVDFSLQMPGNAVLFAVLCGIALHRAPERARPQSADRPAPESPPLALQSPKVRMHQCPRCESEHIHRSRAKSKFESWRKVVTGKRPYRCDACGWRGWGVDLGPKFGDPENEFAKRAVAPEPPNLKGTGLARDEQQQSVNLDALDSLEMIGTRGSKK